MAAHRLEINYIVIKCRVSLSRSPGGIDSLLSPILHIKSLTDGPQSVQCDHLYALINGTVRWVIIFYISRGIFPILIEKFIVRPRYLLFNFGAIEIWFVFVDGFLLFLAPRALHFFFLWFFFRRSPERRRKKLLYIGPGVACFEMRFFYIFDGIYIHCMDFLRLWRNAHHPRLRSRRKIPLLICYLIIPQFDYSNSSCDDSHRGDIKKIIESRN